MRPHERKKTSHAAGVSAVQVLIKSRLHWVSGFVREGRWVSVPRGAGRGEQVLDIDGTLIRRAAYGLRKLRGEYPRALARVVGDADAWAAGVEAILEALKPVAHGGVEAPANLLGRGLFSRSLERDIGALRGSARRAADRMTWALATEPRRLNKVVRFLESSERLPADEAAAVMICHLASDHGERVRHFASLLSSERALAIPLGGPLNFDPYASALARGKDPIALEWPPPILSAALSSFLVALTALESATQKRALALLDACELNGLLAAWELYRDTLAEHRGRAENIAKSHDEEPVRERRQARALKRMHAARKELPQTVAVESLLASILILAASAALTRSALTLAAGFREQLGDGAAAIHYLGALAGSSLCDASRIPLVVGELLGFAGKTPAGAALWRHAMRRSLSLGQRSTGTIDASLLDRHGIVVGRVAIVFSALAELAIEVPDSTLGPLCYRAVEVFAVIADRARGVELLRAVHKGDKAHRHFSEETVQGIVSLAGDSSIAPILASALRLADEADEIGLSSVISTLLSAVEENRAALEALVAAGDLDGIIGVVRQLRALALLGARFDGRIDRPSRGDSEKWMAHYPPRVRGALSLLGQSTASAEKIARKELDRIARSTQTIEKELATLRAKLESGADDDVSRHRLEARRETLTRQLERGLDLSPAEIEKLAERLEKRAAREFIADAAVRAGDQIAAKLAEKFDIDPRTVWLTDQKFVRAIAAALPLPRVYETLRLLLRARAGEPPWDLREERANADFLATLRGRGVDPTPWVDGIGPRPFAGGSIAFEDDPLEIFYMGHHFFTCLSIGAFNFFSVFANAADINKRCIYARDAAGAVVGRQLVCLSSDGKLVVFRAYAHDLRLGFEEASRAFIIEVAAAMKTTTLPRANIPTLVAKDWYDDGSVDVGNRFDFLADGSEFRSSLLRVQPPSLAEALEAAIGQSKVDAVLAPLLIALPEFRERPPLAIELYGLLRAPDELPGDAACQLAFALERAGAHELAYRFAAVIEALLWSAHRRHVYLPVGTWLLLSRATPSRTLRLLRRTRPRGVRRWTDEYYGERVLVAAHCLALLGRRTQARELLERLTGDSDCAARAQALLETLE